MKRNWEQLNLRNAYKPVPEAFRQTVLQTVQSVRTDAPAANGWTFCSMSGKIAIALIAGILLIGMAVAYAVSHPAILNWLLGAQPAPGAPLMSSVQKISGENAADHITVRMDSLIYDGERFSFSYEVENDDPSFPALVAMEPCFLVNGEQVSLEEFMANDAKPTLVPSARLDVLPVQRNPVVCGGWSQVIPEELEEEIACEMTFIVYRPKKAFAIVPDLDDVIFHMEDCAPEQKAEIQDVIDTYLSFQNAVLADQDALDPQTWFQEGYSVISGFTEVTEWIDPSEEGFDHLIETARFTVVFRFDAGIRQVYDFSEATDVLLDDCTVRISSLRLSPLTTHVDVVLIPKENTEEAAKTLAEKYGPMDLTDAQDNPVEYAEMDFLYENMPWVSQSDGQWRCRYLIQMPGPREWPESVGLTVKTGDLLRVKLPEKNRERESK